MTDPTPPPVTAPSPPPLQVPSIGRIVHYQAHGSPDGTHPSVPRAAVVTEVMSPILVSLCVLHPAGMCFERSVELDQSTTPRGGTWHWPPRSP